ncbi:putative amidase C869.01 [Vitis vinifera]|uniref:Putative amidase C869.01 n=1 Tax=Vitis vinifera TaxID=29760 RepID=A0A438IIU0_VITVI|nr:putative amidase C869.01 [Vitis vinifera]
MSIHFHVSTLFLLPLVLLPSGSIAITGHAFSIEEATVHDFHMAFEQNKLTSRQLVEFYLGKIHKLNPILRGVIEVNPDALLQADKADRERKAKLPGSLLGCTAFLYILLKDNIATKDKMNTTAGSFALLNQWCQGDAGVVRKLRKAGAIILGKASLSEWAAFRATATPSGWCARTGQGKAELLYDFYSILNNPYVLSATPCGSSSGSAISVAANLAAVSLGTETDGSILCPSHINSVVGIKPTLGLTSRAGVVPISPRQDTVGDEATRTASKYIPQGGYKQFLNANGLKGKRLGIVRNPFYMFGNGSVLPQVFEHHFHTLRQGGAILVDHLEIANIDVIYGSSGEYAALEAERHKLDALVTPGSDVRTILAIGGFPGISVPAGYDSEGVPFGICFGGLKGSEPKLIEIAYSFEQATKIRKPPSFKP